MLSNSFNNFINKGWIYTIEFLSYVVAAIALVGHVFFIEGTVTYLDVLLIMLGVVFATLAGFLLTPVSNRMLGRDLVTPADVLLFRHGQQEREQSTHVDNQHAA